MPNDRVDMANHHIPPEADIEQGSLEVPAVFPGSITTVVRHAQIDNSVEPHFVVDQADLRHKILMTVRSIRPFVEPAVHQISAIDTLSSEAQSHRLPTGLLFRREDQCRLDFPFRRTDIKVSTFTAESVHAYFSSPHPDRIIVDYTSW